MGPLHCAIAHACRCHIVAHLPQGSLHACPTLVFMGMWCSWILSMTAKHLLLHPSV